MPPISLELFLIAAGVGSLMLTLISLMALLSIARRERSWREHKAATRPHRPEGLDRAMQKAKIKPPEITPPPQPRTHPIPQQHRLPVRAGTPDQVVIQIDPLEGPSQDQRNVQRLIAYLREEMTRANNTSEEVA